MGWISQNLQESFRGMVVMVSAMNGWMGGSAIGSKNFQGVVDKTDNAKCARHALSRRNWAKSETTQPWWISTSSWNWQFFTCAATNTGDQILPIRTVATLPRVISSFPRSFSPPLRCHLSANRGNNADPFWPLGTFLSPSHSDPLRRSLRRAWQLWLLGEGGRVEWHRHIDHLQSEVRWGGYASLPRDEKEMIYAS